MPIYRPPAAATFEVHGSRFHSYLRGEMHAETLRAWELEVPPDAAGARHRPSREEVLLVLDGTLRVTLDGARSEVQAGDVIHVPAGSEFCLDGGPSGARAWVTTTRGLTATLADGQEFSPPWAQ